jgi:DNA polymerase-3 subunit alpha
MPALVLTDLADAGLQIETDTIVQIGFPAYFLIVADFSNWAKQNSCPVRPGRGSGAGSVVAYALGISDLDPLRYALLFQRFPNPERVSMPELDIDFCEDNRWRLIEYIRQKCGADAVSQIVTFCTMSSKAVIRDVGRVRDLPYNFCDQFSKLIPVEINKPLSLVRAIEAEPQLKARIEQEEEVRELFELATRLEDLTRNVGMHAGGVLIAPGKLTEFRDVHSADGGGSVVSQYDKDDVKKVGLGKFDFLGLRNLTTIELALDYVERLRGRCPNLSTLSFDEPAAYQILRDGTATATRDVQHRDHCPQYRPHRRSPESSGPAPGRPVGEGQMALAQLCMHRPRTRTPGPTYSNQTPWNLIDTPAGSLLQASGPHTVARYA